MENSAIRWSPQKDNYIEGKFEDIKIFIRLKKVSIFTLQALGIQPTEGEREREIVDSVYFVFKDRTERTGPTKVMAHEHDAYSIEKMKSVANNILTQFKSS